MKGKRCVLTKNLQDKSFYRSKATTRLKWIVIRIYLVLDKYYGGGKVKSFVQTNKQ